MAIKFDIDISSTDAQTVVRSLAKEDEYSPVVEYLDEIGNKYPDVDTQFLNGLAKQYFGSDDPIHSTYFKKFLVAAVARARQPGCKVDSVFMLMSPQQGKYKSTFFSVLFGEEFFSDQLGTDIGNKDEKMKISQYWCLEWAEFEAIYRRKDVSALKNFITNREDTFRAPYARKDMKHPRPCVFVGTSNEKEILHDPTGDRRFWIVPVTIDKIPLSQVRSDRDKVWAAADALYRSGFQWWLKDEEELVRAEQNKEYQNTSYWDEVIEQLWIESLRPNFLETETIIKRLGFENAKEMKPGDSNELNKSMTRLGFVKSKNPRRVNGVLKRGWVILEDAEKFGENSGTPVTGVTAALYNGSSCYTSVTPPVTGVTENQNNGSINYLSKESNISYQVTPVTPPVTEVQQPEALQIATVTALHPVTPFEQNFEQAKEKLESDNSTQPVQSPRCEPDASADKFAVPPNDDHYNLMKVEPFKFEVETNLGKCQVTATPFKKIKSTGQSVVHLLYEMELGRSVDQVKCVLGKKDVERLAKKSPKLKALESAVSKKWEDRAKVETYRVLKRGKLNEADVWVENCKMVQVPADHNHFFFLDAPDGTRFNASIGDFVVMKND